MRTRGGDGDGAAGALPRGDAGEYAGEPAQGVRRAGSPAANDAAAGKNYVLRTDGSREDLPGTASAALEAGDVFVVETPGGGGFGESGRVTFGMLPNIHSPLTGEGYVDLSKNEPSLSWMRVSGAKLRKARSGALRQPRSLQLALRRLPCEALRRLSLSLNGRG